MSTQYSTSLRLWEGQQNDPAIASNWGTPNSLNYTLIDSAIAGTASVNIAGLTTYNLTTANGAPDQSRELVQDYIGALSATCTVTLPNVPKVGWARNDTTGGHNVIETAGAGTTATLAADGYWYFRATDGATNVLQPNVAFGSVKGAAFIPTSSAVPTNGMFLPSGNIIAFAVSSVEKIRLLATGDIWFTGTSAQAVPISLNNVGMGYSQVTQTLSIYSGTCPLNLAGTFNTQPVTQYFYNQTQVGSVTITPTTTKYNTTSDATLKLDDGLIGDLEAGSIVDRLRPRWFRFKSDPDADKQPGFFAQQVHRVFPWAVTKGRKGRNGHPWQMDASKLLPVVIAELQSLRRRVAELEKARA